MKSRRNPWRLVILPFAVLYFLIDAVFFAALRPFGCWLASWPFWHRAEVWVAGLPPYATLGCFLIPVLLLEPLKPLAAYLVHGHHAVYGIAALVLGEIAKIVVVERLFHTNKAKLLTIPWFARGYGIWLWAKALLLENAYSQGVFTRLRAVRDGLRAWF